MEFSNFISKQGLMDLPLAQGSFTWSNNSSWSRLDRFLVSLDWEARYPGLPEERSSFVSYPPRLWRHPRGKKTFKFENIWL